MKSFLYLAVIVSTGVQWAVTQSYEVETVSFPENVPVEIGAVDFCPDGKLYVALRRGDIVRAEPSEDPNAFDWKPFASGFHNPCGIYIVKPGHIIISQMAELTEVIDTDNDGTADIYRALSTDFGLSGNYHETMDICPDGKGGLYLAPGTASHNGPTFTTPRGEFSDAGRFGRNYSSVKWRGWVLHWNRENGITPISSGYRMHNGIERSPSGDIWCGDNQGDWRSSSPVYHVTEDSFSGHPSSLVWDPRFSTIENPLHLPRRLLDDLWNKPAFRLPRTMMNSCAEPAFDTTKGKFGPFEGQMFIPDQSGDRIVRLMPEWVDGAYQGAATMFIEKDGLKRGNNRLAFSPDGTWMYVGQTGRGWGALSEGLQRIRYTGEMPFEAKNCELTENGFTITFTKPVSAAGEVTLERFTYPYGYTYGGDEINKATITPAAVEVASNNLTLEIAATDLLPNYIYRFHLKGVKSDDGTAFANQLEYTLNRLRRPATAEHKVELTAAGEDRFRITIDGDLFTEIRHTGFSNPILYPIRNASGTELTRDWPIREDGRKDEQKDHPHHKSLFIGHESINGIDFWHEGPEDGTTEQVRVIETRSGQDRALVRTLNHWKNPEGNILLTDTRTWEFGVVNGARYADLELNLHASHGEVNFGEKKDGLIGLRTHPDLRLKPAPGKGVEEVFGHAANSGGTENAAIWGKKADWVHYWGKVDGNDSGIAILSHPENPRHPTWWHARDYGLVAANPFGPKKNEGDGELILPEGESLTLRYRFIFHDKAGEDADIATQFTTYHSAPLFPRTPTIPIPTKSGEEKTLKIPTNVNPRGDVISSVTRVVNGKKADAPEVKIHSFVEGQRIFKDRAYQFSSIPDHLRGGDLVVTYNDDKKSGKKANYEVKIGQPGMLHVLVDPRAEKSMEWLTSGDSKPAFKATRDIVKTSANFTYKVYVAEVDPGTYTLGNQTDGSFYSIIAVTRD
ncbi:MAG: PmoA family protein [Verrucomicrobiales bacterium]|nr:PmoA family protein [Verrucomicrobiales bacterium]